MIEHSPGTDTTTEGRLDPRLDIDQQYMGTAVNVLSRFQLYRHAIDGRDIHQEIVTDLALQPTSVLVDVGCADGSFLQKVINSSAPRLAIGLELDPLVLAVARVRRPQLKSAGLLAGNAVAIGLADNSVDAVTALFMLYHTPSPQVALAEFHRILKPDGKLVVATSGTTNKVRHREFERDIADYLGITTPPIFSEPFNADRAETTLSEKFCLTKHVTQETEMHIRADAISEYEMSLTSMKDTFSPIPAPSDWMQALGAVVLPHIHEAIESVGYFSDKIERHYYVCQPK